MIQIKKVQEVKKGDKIINVGTANGVINCLSGDGFEMDLCLMSLKADQHCKIGSKSVYFLYDTVLVVEV